jgi:hypothetical protein
MFYNYKSPSTTTTSSLSTTTLPSESQSIFICTSVHKFSPCSYFVYSNTADNFFAPTIYGDLLCYLHRLWHAWLMVVHVFAHLVLATSARAFVPDTLPSLGNSALRIELLRLPPRLPQVLLLQTANTTANFSRLNDDIDHDNINFIYDDYITNGIIDHD